MGVEVAEVERPTPWRGKPPPLRARDRCGRRGGPFSRDGGSRVGSGGRPRPQARLCAVGHASRPAPSRRRRHPRKKSAVYSLSPFILGYLAEDAKQVAAPELVDALLGIAAAQHGVSDHGEVADVAHASRQRRAAVEVAAERDMIFADEMDGFIHHVNPLVHRHRHAVGQAWAYHRHAGTLHRVDLVHVFALDASGDAADVPEAGLLCLPHVVVGPQIVKVAADLESEHAALGRQLLHQVIGHTAGDIDDAAHAAVGCDQRMVAHVDGLRDRLIARMGHIDDHAEAVHLVDDRAAVLA